MSLQYRKDIDGLRAIAVLSVIAFHINNEWLAGGFLGVDIFFVISGYLISLLLIREIHTSRGVSLAGFYERRVRRIMPALVTVITASLLAGLCLLTPDKLAAHLHAVVWSLFSLANIHFFGAIETGYFADASGDIPLLHLWSLGVEEQFYIFWPLLLLLVFRCIPGAGGRLLLLGVLGILSLALAQFLLGQPANRSFAYDSFAYYMLPTRAWELLAGGVVALLVHEQVRVPARLAETAAGLGLVAIGASLAWVSEDDGIPGVAALPAILGTALLIWTGSHHRTLAGRLLSVKPAVLVGLVSYSAYLWHWPILAFIRYAEGEVSNTAGGLAFVATLVLASASYRYIEKPTRRLPLSRQRLFATYLVIPVAVLTLACLALQSAITRKSPWLMDWPSYDTAAARVATLSRYSEDYPFSCNNDKHYNPDEYHKAACVYPASPAPRVLLLGDSNAAHYLGAMRVWADAFHFSFRNLNQSACSFILGNSDLPWVDRAYAEGCRQYREHMTREITHYDTVIIGGSWTTYDKKNQREGFRRALADSIRQLSATVPRVIILGKIPKFSDYNSECELRALRLPWLHCATRYDNEQPDHDVNQFLRELAAQYDNVDYLDIRSQLCRDNHCSPYLDGKPVYRDGGHLNLEGAAAIAEAMLRNNDPALAVFSRWQAPAVP